MAVDAQHGGAAARRTQQIEQQPDRRRLAGAVGAEEAVDFPRRHLERQILDADDGAVVLGEAVGANRRVRHYRPCLSLVSSRSDSVTTSCVGRWEPWPVMTICPGCAGTTKVSGATEPTTLWL